MNTHESRPPCAPEDGCTNALPVEKNRPLLTPRGESRPVEASRPPEKPHTGAAEATAPIPVSFPLPPPKALWGDPRMRRLAVLGLLAVVGALCLLPTLRACRDEGDHGVLPSGPSETSPATEWDGSGTAADTPAVSLPSNESVGAESDVPTVTEPAPDSPEGTGGATEAESPLSPPSSESETESAEPTYSESVTEALPSDGESETVPHPAESDVPESSPGEVTPSETPPPETAAPETEPLETVPAETMPPDAFPVVSVDLSEPEHSVGYIHSTADRLPPSIPAEGTRLWSTEGQPTVLIVHSHPYEGYHDGRAWYDPASGSLAQTGSPNDPDGVVALGAALTRHLRDAGVTVIHLRVPVAAGESAAATYARTEETVRYYCELYPDIGLVLDLRRSAELSENGEILRTAGNYQGAVCAQLRLSVSGDRASTSVSRDIAVAVSLRRALWGTEPTLSRPVWVKSGSGLVGDMDRVAHLTVELGSSGNSFSEAEALIAPLGDAVSALVKK